MATETVSIRSRQFVLYTWGAGIVGGFLGGITMGIVLHTGANLMPFIGALVSWPSVLGGWAVHLVYSVILGILFALLVSRWNLHDQTTNLREWAFYGILYAAAIGLVTGGIMIPATLNMMGATTLPDPSLPLPGVFGGLLVAFSVGVAHMVYGVTLGTIFGRIHNMSESSQEFVK